MRFLVLFAPSASVETVDECKQIERHRDEDGGSLLVARNACRAIADTRFGEIRAAVPGPHRIYIQGVSIAPKASSAKPVAAARSAHLKPKETRRSEHPEQNHRIHEQTERKWCDFRFERPIRCGRAQHIVDVVNLDDGLLEESLSVNLKAAFRLSKAAIPHMRKQGDGRLLFTSSVTGPRVAMPGSSYYAASKSGLNGFIRTAAIELARDGITVNGVEPGFIKTPAMNLLADEEGQKVMCKYIPMGKLGVPEDIAYAMLFLASDLSGYITGQTIIVDGGSTLPESPVFADQETAGVTTLGKT